MAEIVWSQRYELGVPFIDADHRVLVGLLNRVDAAAREGATDAEIGGILAALLDYTRYHFAREERAQAAAAYPDLKEHKAQHRRLTERVRKGYLGFLKAPEDVEVGDLLDFLTDWLLDHILLHDMAIKPYVLSALEAVAAAEGVDYAALLAGGAAGRVAWPKLRILLAEDNPREIETLKGILGAAGMGGVEAYARPDAAVEAALAGGFDAAITAWRSGGGFAGLEFVHRVRERGGRIAVVILTDGGPESLEAARAGLGVAEWLPRPVDSAALLAALARQVSG